MLVIAQSAVNDIDHWAPFAANTIHTLVSVPGKALDYL